MPNCYVPWTNLDISPQGEMSPCCKFKNSVYSNQVLNINSSTIDDYIDSPTLKEVKKDFTEGRWPKGCERCKVEEDNGIESKRIQYQKLWSDDLAEDKGFITASVAFGNTCNLTCITCDPSASSKWYQEYKKLYGIEIRPNHFYKEGFVDNLLDNIPNLIHLDIPGGEPFLSGVPQQKELLRSLVDKGKSKNIGLHYMTNCTIYPDDEWFSLWNHFKRLEIQLSIDGLGSRFEYIRYPGKWEEVEQNLKKYIALRDQGKIVLNVSATVSAYSIPYLSELVEWCHDHDITTPFLGRVHNPSHLRPTVWRDDAKKFIIERLEQCKHDLSPFVQLMRSEDDSQHFETFRYRLLRHDMHRKLSFKNTFPEMVEFLVDKK